VRLGQEKETVGNQTGDKKGRDIDDLIVILLVFYLHFMCG